ncbi:response regulator [Paenibacillus filicis]|uniref:Response regulator n=1 Tax=Paenibacillus filicis TaxID=669464 RepID=A0ABU9DN42_9BACL
MTMHKVLLVDDESWVVESLKDLMDWGQYGFEVAGQAYSGVEAMEAIERIRPDVVFTDIRMPEMNGLELLQRARALPFPLHCVVVSGYAEFAYVQKALNYGAVAYCLKPFDEIEISSVLLRLGKLLQAGKPAGDSTALAHLIEDPSGGNRARLEQELLRHGVIQAPGDGIVCVVAIGSGELPGIGQPAMRAKTGTSKTAYLLSDKQAAALRKRWELEQPAGVMGIGISETLTELTELGRAVSSADNLAYQYFITSKSGVYGKHCFKDGELSQLLRELSDAVRDRELAAAKLIFERIEDLFREASLSIRHAFQVYNMTISFLFDLGQTENTLYSYEQLAQTFHHVFLMLGELKQLTERYLKQAHTASPETKNQTFNAILQFVTSNFQQDLSLQGLSEQFYMNPSYISQLFKKEVGETFTMYVSKLRIQYACELLKDTDASVHDIAEKIGYHDYFYFTRLFKKMTGKTPTQYRVEPLS